MAINDMKTELAGGDGGGAAAAGAVAPAPAGRSPRLVVYTAIAGDYDALQTPRAQTAHVDFVCLADSPDRARPGWTFRTLPHPELSAASRNRWAKMHPHLLFPDHDASIYLDGNIAVIGEVLPLAQDTLARATMGLYLHPVRNCLYDEAIECARIGFDTSAAIRRQVQRYALEGFPRHAGLFEANVIVRAHHAPPVMRAMERWWQEWECGVKRDQLSLMYALWKEGIEPLSLGAHDARFGQRVFRYDPHRRPLGRPLTRLVRQIANRFDLMLFRGPAPRTEKA